MALERRGYTVITAEDGRLALAGQGTAAIPRFDEPVVDLGPDPFGIYGDRPDFVLAANPQEAVKGADALAICTEWRQFRVADFAWLKANLATPVIVDGRNLYEPDAVRRHGLLYYAIGRGDSVRVDGMAAEPASRPQVA